MFLHFKNNYLNDELWAYFLLRQKYYMIIIPQLKDSPINLS